MNLPHPSRAFVARFTAALSALGILFGSAGQASAYIVILDMDPSTAPVESSPGILAAAPGPATGFESSVTALAGVPFPVVAYLVFEPGDGALLFDYVGADINWGLPGDMATLSVTGPAPASAPAPGFHPVAGSLASLPTEGFSRDYFDGTMETAGFIDTALKGLDQDSIATLAPFTDNMGGVGYFDDPFVSGDGPFPDFVQFGGFGGGGLPALRYIDLFSLEFTLSGTFGESVTLEPSGIFDPSGLPGDPPVTLVGGDAVFTSLFGGTATTGTFVGGNSATVIPEPSRALLGLLGLGVAVLRRRR